MICKAWVRHFGKSTRTGYVWGMGMAWVRLCMPEYVFAFFKKKKIFGFGGVRHGYTRVRLGTAWVRHQLKLCHFGFFFPLLSPK